MAKKLTSSKAREILHDKSVHGKPLTEKQRRYFGWIAGKGKAKGGLGVIADTGVDIVMPQDGMVQRAQAPGYEGLGYSSKGYKYNSGWGGRFQPGGPTDKGVRKPRLMAPTTPINRYDNIINPNVQLQNVQSNVKQKQQEAESFMAPIRQSAIEFTEGWMKSPMYQEMIQASTKGWGEEDAYTPARQQNLKGLKDKPLFWQKRSLNRPEAYSPDWQGGYLFGRYWPGSHSIEIDKGLTPMQGKFTAVHELSHAADRGGKDIPVADLFKIEDLKEASREKKVKYLSEGDKGNYNYISEPTEVRARLNALRFYGKQFGVYDPYTEKIDVKKLQQIENTNALEQLRQVYTDDQIVELLNTVSKTNKQPTANQQVAQPGKTFLQPTSPKLPKGYAGPVTTPSTELAMSIGGEGGEPAYLIPSFKYGKLLKDPEGEFYKTGEHLGGPFKTWQEAEEFGKIRHQYVEKGQDVPSPIRTRSKYAMGGSMPGMPGMMYARTGQDWKPKMISEAGDVIEDDMGQWAHPGEVTKINSNQITMQDVPYPVLGISDTGDTQVMQPEGEYQFEGSSVTEIPLEQEEQTQPKPKKEWQIVLGTKSQFDADSSFKDLVADVATKTKINPRWLFSSAFVEGMNLAALKPTKVSEGYLRAIDRGEDLTNYPIDGFYNYGLDRFSEKFKEFVKKGYLPVDFDYKPYKAVNELNEVITTAAFKNNRDALMAKAAFLKHERDNVRLYAKSKGIKLTPEEEEFFTMAFYNSPKGGMSMLNTIAQEHLNPTQYIQDKTRKRGQVYNNVMPRYRLIQALQGVFKSGGVVRTEQDMGQLKKLDQLLNFTNYNPHG